MSQDHAEYQINKPVPYKIHIDDDLLSLTKQKLELARYPDELSDLGDDDWSHGTKVEVVRRLANYWKDSYDWRAEEVCHSSPFLHSCVTLLSSSSLTISQPHRQRSTKTTNSTR